MRRAVLLLACATFGCSNASEPLDPNGPTLHLYPDAQGLALQLGVERQLPVELIGPAGDTLALPATLQIFSRNPNVVATGDGLRIFGLGPGTTRVIGTLEWNGRTLTDSVTVAVSCTTDLIVHVTPSVISLAVGGSITPGVALYTCGGYDQLVDTYTWTAVDPTVISVDPVTGRTTGLRTGGTGVAIHGAIYGNLGGIPVKVH